MNRHSLHIALVAIALLFAVTPPVFAKGRGVREKVAWAQLPAAVQATIEKHASGGKVVAIEKRSRRGTVTYTAEVRSPDGKLVDIEVNSDGTLLGIEAGGGD
jgi:hypothetical protein